MRKLFALLLILTWMCMRMHTQAQTYTMLSSGSSTITTCSGVIYDPGGTSDYSSNCDSYLTIYPGSGGSKVRLTGTYNTEGSTYAWDYFYVYDGTSNTGTQLGYFYGLGTCDVTSISGPLTIYFHSDGSVQHAGFELNVSCCTDICACLSPTGVHVRTGNRYIKVLWDPTSLTNGYFVEYGPHGFTPGTGTRIYTSTTSYTLNNLISDTEYDVYIWFDCGNDHQITTESPAMVSATPGSNCTMTSGTREFETCNGFVYDNGGPAGNYSNYSNDTLIIYPATNGCKVSLVGTYYTESASFDYIKIYDGSGVSGTLLGKFAETGTIIDPIYSTSPDGTLTVVFHSDGSVQKSGYEFQVACICYVDHVQDTVCYRERYQNHGFDTSLAYSGDYSLIRVANSTLIELDLHVRPSPYVSIAGRYYFCADGDITLTANNAISYSWSTGEHSQSIHVHDIGSYQVTITDSNGCLATASHRIAPIDEFIDMIDFPTMCAGKDYLITGSYESGSEILMHRIQSTLSTADTAFLPDGIACEPYGCSYRSTLTFTDYSSNAYVRDANDIYYVKINMEHSYIGDIYINITCPNGQKADIMRWSGSGSTECNAQIPTSATGWQSGDNYMYAYFGQAYDYQDYNDYCDRNASSNAPGIGWNYCWSNNTTQGFVYAATPGSLVYRSANVHAGIVDSSDVNGGTQFYHPDQAFSSLVGCPLNGDWYIEVVDGYGADNGYIFGWELALTEELLPDNTFNVSEIIPVGPWITGMSSDTSFTISPPGTLQEDTTVQYLLHFYDSDNCSYDTLVRVSVNTLHYSDTVVSACESFTWHGVTYTQSGSYNDTLQTSAGCDSIVTLHLTIDTPPDPPTVSPSTLICPGDMVTLTAECEDAILLTEGFSSITDGGDENASAPGSDTIHCNTLATFPIMSYVYPAGGKVKFGKGSYANTAIPGSMTSVPLNLSRPFKVVVRAKNWAWGGQTGGNVDGTLVITAGSQTLTQTVNTSQYSDYTFNFNAAGLTPITIASNLPGWRLIIDSVYITMEKECTYTWSASPSTEIIPDIHAQSITAHPEETTTFTLHQTSNSCTLDTSITVSVVPPPTITGGGFICEGESVTLSAECPDLVVLEEDFSMCTTVNANISNGDISTFPVTDNVRTDTDTGSVILGVGGMGTTTTGEITSIPLDLTSDFKVTVRARKKNNDVEMYVVVGSEMRHQTVASTDFADYEFDFTGQPGWGQETIHIYNELPGGSMVNGLKRLSVTNVQVEMNCAYTWTATPAMTMADSHAQSISVSPAETTLFSLQQSSGNCMGDAATTVYVVPIVSITGEDWMCEGDTVTLTAECPDLVVLEEDFSMCTTVNANVLNGDIPTFPVTDKVRTDTDTGSVILGIGGMGTTTTGEITSIPLDLTSDFKVTVRARKKNNDVEMYVVVGSETRHQTVASTDFADYEFDFTGQPGWGQETIHVYNELPGGSVVNGLKRLSITDVQVQVEPNCTYTWTASPALTITDPHAQSITVSPAETTVFTLTQTTDNCTQNVAQTVTVSTPNHQSYTIETCESYTWVAPQGDGQTYSSSGDYLWSHNDSNGCLQVDTLHLIINQPVTTTTSATACESYTWNGQTYTVSDEYTQTFTASNGCDSVVTLNLTVNVPTTGVDEQEACDHFTWIDGVTYMENNNTATYTLTNAAGCDSVVTLHLTINEPTTGDTTAVECNSFDWYEYAGLTTSGDYTHVFAGGNAAGCDSILTLHLTIHESTTSIDERQSCGDFTWINGAVYSESTDTPTVTLTSLTGCDSVVTLHLTIKEILTSIDRQESCGAYTWINGETYTASTDTPTYTLTSSTGCDSVVTLHLTINEPTTGDTTAVECERFDWYEYAGLTTSGDYTHVFAGGNVAGCDSVVTLHLTINEPTTGDTTAVECGHFDWYERSNLTQSGDYTHVFAGGNAAGCDSVVTLHLTINEPTTGDTTAVECERFNWYEHENLTRSGDYTHVFVGGNANGCDSTVTLHLTIHEPTTGDTTAVECGRFDWYAHTNLTESGDYTHVLVGGNAAGCDSTVTLHLTIHEPTTGDTMAVECERFDWYEHENLTRSGEYTHVFAGGNAAGCDSIVTLHLTINEPTTGDTTAVECDSFDWYENTTLTRSGEYTHVFVGGNANGCDSTVTLHLTINQPTTGDTSAVECGSFDWYEHSNLTESGDYTHVFAGGNAAGCDSTVTLHLTINQPTVGDTSAVECERFDWYEHTNITESGVYTHVFVGGNAAGCDSIVTLHLTINEPTTGDTTAVECGSFDWYERSNLTESGDYTHVFVGGNAVGCDSTVTLHLTIHESTASIDERQSCGEFTWIDGNTYSESTDTPTVTLASSTGCDSVVTLHLTIKEILTSIDRQESCGAYTWINDVTYMASTDTPTVTLTSSTGCDSTVTLHLTINQPTTGDTTAVECGSFDWYERSNLTESGDYTHVFVGGNANGCDSVVVLHLLIQKPDTIRYDRTVCKGTRFQEYGFDTLMTTSGTHLFTRTLYAQLTPCDTLIELTLHVTEPAVVSTVAQSVCPSSNSVVVVAQFQNLSGDNNAVTWTSNNVVETHDNLVTPLHPKDSFTMQIPLNLCDDSLFYTVEYSDGICMVTETNFIHVVDTVPPAVNGVLPSLNLAGCSEDDVPSAFTNAAEINALDNISIADNCTSMENITIQHSDSVVSASCDISIVRTYTLTDVCGNATRLMQDITLVRTSDFTISQVDTADTVICFSMALAENFTLPEVQDACGLVLQPSSDSPTVSGLDGSCEGLVQYTYTYRNCSGGDTVWTFTYHIALPDSFTNFPATGVGEVQCLADVFPPTPPVVEDACGNTLNVTSLDSTQNVNPDGSGTVDFLFRYSDCAGNDSVWTYTYILTPNQFTPKPNLFDTVYCVSEALDDTIPVVTNCGIPVALTHGVDTNRVEDGCGDMAYVYNYTVNDVHYTWTHYYHVAPEPFVLPVTPEFFVQCLDSAVQVDPPVVVNACSDTIHPIALPVSIHSDGCTGYVTYAWDYVDCSGDTARWTCTYVVADTTPPTFIVPADMVICRDTNGTYDADPAVTGIAIRISDNCSSLQEISNSCQETLIAGANGVDTLLRQWIVKDNCDNENVQTQRITIMPVRYTTIVDSICEGEMYDTLNFNFVANVDTVVYQQLSSHETGCDSLITLNLTVFHPVNESDSVTTIDEYTWNGITYALSGMYTHHHPDIHGCDQVDTLYLTIHYPSSSDIYDTACDIYTWNGVDYTESGVYTQHFTNEFNVDSTVVLHLTINHSKHTTIYDTVCYTYEWNGVVYTETGVYEQYFLTSDGCDSIVTLELRVNYNKETNIQMIACEEYTWYDVTYTETGIYTKTLESSDLCDSTVILYLTINHDVSLEWWDTVCNVKQWNDEFYAESGEYVQHFETALGCDSAVTLHLVVNHSDTTSFDATSCDTYTWENMEYAQSGEHTRKFTNQFGCDSVVTMRLTIHSATYSTLYDTITQNSLPYDTLGMHFTGAGTKKDTILNQYGCDSIVTMHLFVAQNIVVEVDSTICENDLPFTWNHVVFNQAGTMNDTLTAANGSDSIIVMTLNVNSNTYSAENEFVIENNLPHVFNGHTFTGPVTNEQIVIPNANGCDSIITYSLQVWYNVKDTVERTICENDLPYSWNNVQFTAPGMQNAVFTLPNGADSVLTMVLFVHNNTQSTIYDTIVENDLPYDTLDMHFSDAGTLSDTIANANGCDSIVTMHLYVWYNVANTVDSTVCENNLPIVWNDVVFEAAGENTIVLVGNHGVDSVLTMRLAVIPKDVSVFHDEVCEGRDYFGHGFVVPGNQTVHIPGHHLSIENTFENELGCDSIVHLELDIVDTTVYIRPLFDFCDNMSTTLSVYTQLTDYVWSTGETSQNIDVTAPGLYSVTAMQGDCQSEAVISIEDCPTEIYLPNAITPGKLDGHNDCFSLPERYQNMIDEFEITIFNRWGQPVFHSKDKAFKWYGEYKDNVYRQNVYEYLIDYMENNRFHRKVKLRGSVVVL